MKLKITALLAALAALAAAGCGSDDAGNSTDRAFVAGMVPHHESAVEMATIAQDRAKSPFVKTLADNIIRTQNAEIATMREEDAQLADAGVEKGDLGMSDAMMGMNHDAGMLKTAEAFDAEFLRMMIPHHEGAIPMARMELEKGADPELKKLAEDIIAAQQKEIDQMKQQLAG